MAVNTSTISYASFGYSEMFVAAPFELDYDEPNAVVTQDEVEFVTTIEAVQAVELPVCSGIVEEVAAAKPAKQIEVPVVPALRTAA